MNGWREESREIWLSIDAANHIILDTNAGSCYGILFMIDPKRVLAIYQLVLSRDIVARDLLIMDIETTSSVDAILAVTK